MGCTGSWRRGRIAACESGRRCGRSLHGWSSGRSSGPVSSRCRVGGGIYGGLLPAATLLDKGRQQQGLACRPAYFERRDRTGGCGTAGTWSPASRAGTPPRCGPTGNSAGPSKYSIGMRSSGSSSRRCMAVVGPGWWAGSLAAVCAPACWRFCERPTRPGGRCPPRRRSGPCARPACLVTPQVGPAPPSAATPHSATGPVRGRTRAPAPGTELAPRGRGGRLAGPLL